MDEQIEIFVDMIISKIKAFADLDPEVKNQVKEDFINQIEDQINYRIICKIPEDKLKHFECLCDTGLSSEINAFISIYVPDLDGLIQEELQWFWKNNFPESSSASNDKNVM